MDNNLEQRIKDLIEEYMTKNYDPEGAHLKYDSILEDFALNYDPKLLPLVTALIAAPKKMWYA